MEGHDISRFGNEGASTRIYSTAGTGNPFVK